MDRVEIDAYVGLNSSLYLWRWPPRREGRPRQPDASSCWELLHFTSDDEDVDDDSDEVDDYRNSCTESLTHSVILTMDANKITQSRAVTSTPRRASSDTMLNTLWGTVIVHCRSVYRVPAASFVRWYIDPLPPRNLARCALSFQQWHAWPLRRNNTSSTSVRIILTKIYI